MLPDVHPVWVILLFVVSGLGLGTCLQLLEWVCAGTEDDDWED